MVRILFDFIRLPPSLRRSSKIEKKWEMSVSYASV